MNIDTEQLITLAEAAASIPSSRGGGTIHPATVHRWRTRGVGGVRLEAARIGGTIYTTREAVGRFIDALNSDEARGDQRASTPATQSRARQAEIDRAERELAEAGI